MQLDIRTARKVEKRSSREMWNVRSLEILKETPETTVLQKLQQNNLLYIAER